MASVMRSRPVFIIERGIARLRRIYPAELPTNSELPPLSSTPALFAKKSGIYNLIIKHRQAMFNAQ